MKQYSVWYMPYNKKYLITHPWVWFKCAWRNIQDAWRRSVYGWTYGDVWDWNTWFLRTTPHMLRHMAQHGSAYPGIEPYETPEKWHNWLNQIADLLESADEAWQDEHNEYYSYWNSSNKENKTKYYTRSRELEKQGAKNLQKALEMIQESFWHLWD